MRTRRLGLAPIATIGFGVGFALWTWLVFAGALTWLDALAAPPAQWQSPAVQIAAAVAVVCHPFVVYSALAGIAIWAFRRRLRNLTLAVLGSVALGWGGQEVLRRVFQRERPPGSLPELITNQGYAYPSGHLVAVTVAALLVIATTTTTRQPRRVIELWRWLGIGLILLVSADRWLLHAHYVSDLVGGLLWGGFAASLCLSIARVHMQPVRPVRAASKGAEPKRCAIVVNPTKIPDWAAFRRHVEFDCKQNGWQPMFLETSVDDPGRGMTRAAIEANVDLVLVAGGDGTVRVVCAELSGTDIPLGVLPSGTGNLLARNLSVPLDESAALEVVFHGERKRIDLVEVVIDDAEPPEHIAVMAGLGLDARIMSGTDDGLKKVIGPAAYVVAAGDAASLPSFDVTVTLDEAEAFERHAGLVMVGNVGSLQGNVQLLPDAQFDDGLLDLFVASPANVADWLRITTSVILPVPEASEIDRGQGRTVLIECTEPVEYQLDGDAAGECRTLRATVVPQTLTVMVPD